MIKTGSYLAGISYSIALNFLSKGLLFFTNLLIAYFFGASSGTDLYFFLMSCILLVANFIIGINGSVIIPESRRLEHQAGKNATFGFINLTFLLLFGALLLACIVMFLFPIQVLSFISNFKEDFLEENKNVILLATFLFFIQIVVSFFNDLLVYYRYFVLPSIITSLNGLLTIILIWMFHAEMGLKSVLLAGISAYFISLLGQIFLLLKFEHWSFLTIAKRIERLTFFNALYSIGSITFSILVSFMPLFFLSTYAAGAITQLVLAQRIAEIPNTLLAIQFVTIIGVQLTEKYMTHDLTGFNKAFIRASEIMCFTLVPISVTAFFLSKEIIELLLQHGAIQKQSSQIDEVLAILMIGVPFTGINYLTSKALAASQKIKAGFYFNMILSTVNIGLSFAGISLAAQVGYAWAVSVYAITYFLLCFFLLKKAMPYLNYAHVLKFFLSFLLVNMAGMYGIVALYDLILINSSSILKIVIVTFVYFSSILIINYFIKFNIDAYEFTVSFIAKLKTNK